MSLQKITSSKDHDQNLDSGSCVQVFFSLIHLYWNWDTDASVALCQSEIQFYKQNLLAVTETNNFLALRAGAEGVVSCWYTFYNSSSEVWASDGWSTEIL